MRVNDGEIFYWAKPLPTDLRRRLADAAGIGSGIVVEDKDYSLALHYRKAPEHAEQLRRHIAAARTAFSAEPTELLARQGDVRGQAAGDQQRAKASAS